MKQSFANLLHRPMAIVLVTLLSIQTSAMAAAPRVAPTGREGDPARKRAGVSPRVAGTPGVGEPMRPLFQPLGTVEAAPMSQLGAARLLAAAGETSRSAEKAEPSRGPVIAVLTGFVLFGAVVVLAMLTEPESPEANYPAE